MKKRTDILFLLKKNASYGTYTGKYSGLTNATDILIKQLVDTFGIEAHREVCVDGNEIDKFVTQYKPKYVILEAIWVTPEKMLELVRLHEKFGTEYITRVHSCLPFLANEGNAIDWLFKISQFSHIAANNLQASNDLNDVNISNLYLPNVYKDITPPSVTRRLKDWYKESRVPNVLDIGCFGSIRPLKNQLIQAAAAIIFADANGVALKFHINGGRVEQNGSPNLKNIRALFEINPQHTLVEHGWLEPEDFYKVLKHMDLSMQMSFTESFNIVSADAVYEEVPLVVSKEVAWADKQSKADTTDIDSMVEVIANVLKYKKRNIQSNLVALNNYNLKALHKWEIFA